MIRDARGRWQAVILVCGKCSKKLGGGFGAEGDQSLTKALRRRTGKGKRAAYGIVETKCLKLCPKNAVAVVHGADPGRWLVIGEGEPVEAVAARLGLPDRSLPDQA
jgi:predicted metal-binding protein